MHVPGPMQDGGGRREEMRMRKRTGLGRTLLALLALGAAPRAYGFCGCDKPPPPLAHVRPFVGNPDQTITLFDDRLVPGSRYTVQFTSRDGVSDWSRGKAVTKLDFADPGRAARWTTGATSSGPTRKTIASAMRGARWTASGTWMARPTSTTITWWWRSPARSQTARRPSPGRPRRFASC